MWMSKISVPANTSIFDIHMLMGRVRVS